MTMTTIRALALIALLATMAPAAAQSPAEPGPPAADSAPEGTEVAPRRRTPAPTGAELYFHYPFDGKDTPPRITVRFGLRAIGVAPAGIDKPNTGHHHLLIDTDARDLNLDLPIPADENHLHFGNGQTEVKVTLTPGRHTLQLLLGDSRHIAHDPPILSKKITVNVRARPASVAAPAPAPAN